MRHKHRATGNPRGRPPSVPFDLDTQIYDVLQRKMNPDTHMVRPQWKELARELGVSRSTISRVMPSLKSAGLIESVVVTSPKNAKYKYVLYKVNDWGRQTVPLVSKIPSMGLNNPLSRSQNSPK